MALLLALSVSVAACGGDEDASDDPGSSSAATSSAAAETSFVADIVAAVAVLEAELGGPQEFFEVTATPALVNLFVAVDDATAVVAYLWVDGELQPPAPKQDGASGSTFVAADIDVDPDTVLDTLTEELPNTTIDAFSVYGDGFGATYVVAGRSAAGGALDIVLGPDGSVRSVDPV